MFIPFFYLLVVGFFKVLGDEIDNDRQSYETEVNEIEQEGSEERHICDFLVL
ncbi:MAG: hypothetical protein AB7P24_10510 [Nitrospira sp.]